MQVKIQDGSYEARLDGAQTKLTMSGKLMIVFAWKLESGESIRSASVINQADGALNPKAIDYIRRWCPQWDGADPYYFEEHIDELKALKVRLSIRNEPSYRDPSVIEPKVKWVNPLTWSEWKPKRVGEVEGEGSDDALDPEALMTSLSRDGEIDLKLVLPTMNEVWSAYAYLCRDVPRPKRNACWIAAVARLVPGKDQIDFTAEDWERVLEWVRGK